MALSREALRDLYRKRAPAYDFSANLYYLIGFREIHYRKQAVAALDLRPGDTVVELGCGTGLNFKYLRRDMGNTGRLLGVDLADAMLAQAAERIKRKGWNNVELVRRDAAEFSFPAGTNGVISTFALTLVPEYEEVIGKAAKALGNKGRLVVLDFKLPQNWPLWLVKLFAFVSRPFGVTLDLAERKPWKSMERHFSKVSMNEMYGGLVYIAVGSNGEGPANEQKE
mgnify:CR=1 FL=1